MLPPGSDATAAPQGSSSIIPGLRVRLANPSIESIVGIQTAPAEARALSDNVSATARIEFNQNAMADIRSSVPGVVREVGVELGQLVEPGDVLFTLESAHVGTLQADRRGAREQLRTAELNLERQRELHAGAITSARQLELAERDVELAQSQLVSLEQSLRISGAAAGGRSGRFEITAPIGGSIIHRPGIVGSFAAESQSLATIVDTSTMWVLLNVPEWDAAALQLGQAVDVQVDGISGEEFSGTVSWIAAEVDSRTRIVDVRVELPNPDRLLRAGQFAQARIHLAGAETVITVPVASLQRIDDETAVFVRIEAGVFEPRVVEVVRADTHYAQVSGELSEGEDVVTIGAYLLKTELNRDSIGAGCCEVEGLGDE
jgi:cobalt-zinc-cadmium efflux system membrane fusion protein